MENKIQLFEKQKVRTVWDEESEKWWFSIVDIVAILTDSNNPQVYWRVLKKRLIAEGNQTVTNCNGLKMQALDGKMRVTDGVEFAVLTDVIYQTWAEKSAKEYKKFKGLKKENLRDNMTNKELVLSMLAELSTKEISETMNPDSFGEHVQVAQQGGEIAKNARIELEIKTGKKVVTPLNAKNIRAIGNEQKDAEK